MKDESTKPKFKHFTDDEFKFGYYPFLAIRRVPFNVGNRHWIVFIAEVMTEHGKQELMIPVMYGDVFFNLFRYQNFNIVYRRNEPKKQGKLHPVLELEANLNETFLPLLENQPT